MKQRLPIGDMLPLYESNDHGPKNTDNRRNGYTGKSVKSSYGEIPVEVPRDRDSSFFHCLL